jgi:hypothetical protein
MTNPDLNAVRELAQKQAAEYLTVWGARLPPLADSLKLFQVFTASAKRLRHHHLLEVVREAGWHGVLVSADGGRPVATSEIYQKNEYIKPSGFLVDGRTVHLVEEWFRLEHAGNGGHEPRFLEVPSVGVEALWLHGEPEMFITQDGCFPLSVEQMENMISLIYSAKAPSRNLKALEEPA